MRSSLVQERQLLPARLWVQVFRQTQNRRPVNLQVLRLGRRASRLPQVLLSPRLLLRPQLELWAQVEEEPAEVAQPLSAQAEAAAVQRLPALLPLELRMQILPPQLQAPEA